MSSEIRRSEVQEVTRDVEPSALTDLLDHPRRATVAFVDRDEVDVVPVRARFRAGTYFFGVVPGLAPDLEDREVVLLIDDGPYWFQLRGVSVRGLARRHRADPGETDALAWYAIEPRRTLAWDYGAVRRV
jgi:hypothetical protein